MYENSIQLYAQHPKKFRRCSSFFKTVVCLIALSVVTKPGIFVQAQNDVASPYLDQLHANIEQIDESLSNQDNQLKNDRISYSSSDLSDNDDYGIGIEPDPIQQQLEVLNTETGISNYDQNKREVDVYKPSELLLQTALDNLLTRMEYFNPWENTKQIYRQQPWSMYVCEDPSNMEISVFDVFTESGTLWQELAQLSKQGKLDFFNTMQIQPNTETIQNDQQSSSSDPSVSTVKKDMDYFWVKLILITRSPSNLATIENYFANYLEMLDFQDDKRNTKKIFDQLLRFKSFTFQDYKQENWQDNSLVQINEFVDLNDFLALKRTAETLKCFQFELGQTIIAINDNSYKNNTNHEDSSVNRYQLDEPLEECNDDDNIELETALYWFLFYFLIFSCIFTLLYKRFQAYWFKKQEADKKDAIKSQENYELKKEINNLKKQLDQQKTMKNTTTSGGSGTDESPVDNSKKVNISDLTVKASESEPEIQIEINTFEAQPKIEVNAFEAEPEIKIDFNSPEPEIQEEDQVSTPKKSSDSKSPPALTSQDQGKPFHWSEAFCNPDVLPLLRKPTSTSFDEEIDCNAYREMQNKQNLYGPEDSNAMIVYSPPRQKMNMDDNVNNFGTTSDFLITKTEDKKRNSFSMSQNDAQNLIHILQKNETLRRQFEHYVHQYAIHLNQQKSQSDQSSNDLSNAIVPFGNMQRDFSTNATTNSSLLKRNSLDRDFVEMIDIDNIDTNNNDNTSSVDDLFSPTAPTQLLKLESSDQIKQRQLQAAKDQILQNGRYQKQFEEIAHIGKGGFGFVMKCQDRLEEQIYAIKKVRLHLPITGIMQDQVIDLRAELRKHKVYREVKALSSNVELKHTVRYFTSWLEDLTEQEQAQEQERLEQYQEKQNLKAARRERKLSSISESKESSSQRDTGASQQYKPKKRQAIQMDSGKSMDDELHSLEDQSESDEENKRKFGGDSSQDEDEYGSEEESEEESENDFDISGAMHSKMSIVKLTDEQKDFLSLSLFIQMEYCTGENLSEFIERRQKNDRQENLHIFHQLAKGVASIHAKSMVHRDLKPLNIFRSENGQIKIGDFGLAKSERPCDDIVAQDDSCKLKRELENYSASDPHPLCGLQQQSSTNDTNSSPAGTRRYMAPEWTELADSTDDPETLKQLLEKQKLSPLTQLDYLKALDMYALGIILSDLICNPNTFMESMRIDGALKKKVPELPKGYKLEGLVEGELMLALVDPDPSKRPSIDQLKEWTKKWKKQLEPQPVLLGQKSADLTLKPQKQITLVQDYNSIKSQNDLNARDSQDSMQL